MEEKIRVRYGGHLSRVTNKEEEWIVLDTGLSVSLFLAKIYERYKGSPESRLFGDPGSFLVTLNEPFVPASQAKPDGYTMLADDSASSSLLAASNAKTRDLPFETMNRTYIATIKADPFVIFVPSTSPFKTLKEFVVEAKKNTKEISYTAGPTALEYAVRQLFNAVGVDISLAKAMMCRGASDAVLLAAGGHVTRNLGRSWIYCPNEKYGRDIVLQ